jgi:hypothetical protein
VSVVPIARLSVQVAYADTQKTGERVALFQLRANKWVAIAPTAPEGALGKAQDIASSFRPAMS